jgi:hypothetical protein
MPPAQARRVTTDAEVRTARSIDGKRTKYYAGEGLYLLVRPAGTKSWRINYMRDGKSYTETLGQFPNMLLDEARAARLEVRRTLFNGADPIANRRARRASAVPPGEQVAGLAEAIEQVAGLAIEQVAGLAEAIDRLETRLTEHERLLRRFLAATHEFAAYGTLRDWCALTGMRRSGTYDALSRGDLHAKKAGRRLLIDVQAGLEWLRSQPDAVVNLKRAPPPVTRTTN